MRYIWLTDSETSKDFVAPLEKIGAIYSDKGGVTVVCIDGIEFEVAQSIAVVLDRIKTVRKKTAPKGKKVDERAGDIVLGSLELGSGMKMFIEKNEYSLVLRVFDPDSSYNCSSSGINLEDLENIRKLMSKLVKASKVAEEIEKSKEIINGQV